MRHSQLVVITISLIFLTVDQAKEPPPKYRFFQNGHEFTPDFIYIDGTKEAPAPTDLISFPGFTMVLGTEKEQRFYWEATSTHILWEEKQGKRRPAFISLIRGDGDEQDRDGRWKLEAANDLAKLSIEDRCSIRGVKLGVWSAELGALLQTLQADQVCFSLTRETAADGRKFPLLPAAVRYVTVSDLALPDLIKRDGIQDFSPLTRLKQLRYFSLYSKSSDFDCSLLRNIPHLSQLLLQVPAVRNAEILAANTKLKDLTIYGTKGLREIGFVRELQDLRYLNIRRSEVTDLTPLAGHPTLEYVLADTTSARRLPLGKPTPKLWLLSVLSTAVTDADTDAFKQLNPQCILRTKWERSLAEAVAPANRLRIRTGGSNYRTVEKEKTLFEEKDARKITQLVQQIAIEKERPTKCSCFDEPCFEFYRDNRLLATVGYHHGTTLRWGSWPGDGVLTAESAKFLRHWLLVNIPGFKETPDPVTAGKLKTESDYQRFVTCFPEPARRLFPAAGDEDFLSSSKYRGDKDIGKRFLEAVGTDQALLLAACRAFGVLDRSDDFWDMPLGKETIVLEAVKMTRPEVFTAELTTMQDDNASLYGAARLFFSEGFDQRLQAADRSTWRLKLATIALDDGGDNNKHHVLRQLGRVREPMVQTFLRRVLAGTLGKELQGPPLNHEPSLPAAAAVQLASQGIQDIKPTVVKMLTESKDTKDKVALEVALALLGDPAKLHADQLKLISDTIGFGALQAIEQFEGKHGVDLLFEHGLSIYRESMSAEVMKLANKLSGHSWTNDDQGRKEAKQWWKEHGAEFVEKQRKKKP